MRGRIMARATNVIGVDRRLAALETILIPYAEREGVVLVDRGRRGGI